MRNFRPSATLGVSDGESVYKGWVDGSSYTPSICGVGIAVTIKISSTDNAQNLREWQVCFSCIPLNIASYDRSA